MKTLRPVDVVEPREPMAWAIGTMRDEVFHCAWHAERVLGAKAVAAERSALVSGGDAQVMRVWGDDGSIITTPLGKAAKADAS